MAAVKGIVPSPAQAKEIARIWSDWRKTVEIMTAGRDGEPPYNDPTRMVLVKRGWLAPSGPPSTENGYEKTPHAVTDEGLDALAGYLLELRYKRVKACASS